MLDNNDCWKTFKRVSQMKCPIFKRNYDFYLRENCRFYEYKLDKECCNFQEWQSKKKAERLKEGKDVVREGS